MGDEMFKAPAKLVMIDDDGIPNEKQVKDYMELALHLLQKCKWLEEGADIDE